MAAVGTQDGDVWDGMTQEEIILRHSPLVKYVSSRISIKLPASVEVEDLYQAGILGLIDAVSKFDHGRGIKFQTYAEFRIRGAILNELRAMDWVPRAVRQNATRLEAAYGKMEGRLGRPAEDKEVAAELGLSLEDFFQLLDGSRGVSIVSFDDLKPTVDGESRDILEVLADPDVEDPIESIGLRQVRAAIALAIESLPEKERLVITLYYVEELTMNEIGHILKVTESRVSQLHSKAAMRIRARIRKHLR